MTKAKIGKVLEAFDPLPTTNVASLANQSGLPELEVRPILATLVELDIVTHWGGTEFYSINKKQPAEA